MAGPVMPSQAKKLRPKFIVYDEPVSALGSVSPSLVA